ncbi:hypothetical protein P7V44_02670 [Providencia sp. CRE-3FA-0001]|uniref:Uncharacterized protein n=1 Tax=Providencia huashanensis TaxID=3037798 RepID=A0AA42FEI4_9GAMM|nr:hypothetical protein [Providencia sp. CRE-3FA-0001]EMB8478215.1 hypothetical protein [Providencia rettgeri]MDG4695139.1 hypothetical protein [Providencia sp. CRE-3FA-0001]
MTNISKRWVIIACLAAIGSIFITQNIIGVHSFDPYYSNGNAIFARISLFITSLILSASFYLAFADEIESETETGKVQGILYIIVGVALSVYYMFKINDVLLYVLAIATPISIGVGITILAKGKSLHNKYVVLSLLIIMLLAASPFVTMNLFDIERYSRYRSYLIYHGATGIYVIIASIIGSISMIYLTEKHRNKERLFVPEEFISTLTKLTSLRNADMLSEEEFNHQKGELIKSITGKTINGDHLTFLAEIAKLKQQNVLTNEDINKIKAIILSS